MDVRIFKSEKKGKKGKRQARRKDAPTNGCPLVVNHGTEARRESLVRQTRWVYLLGVKVGLKPPSGLSTEYTQYLLRTTVEYISLATVYSLRPGK